jgi:hypothetical protein
VGLEELDALVKKTAHIVTAFGKQTDWRVQYVLFSAAGWTDEAAARADWLVNTSATARGKQRWRPMGAQVVDLAAIDHDLAEWGL